MGAGCFRTGVPHPSKEHEDSFETLYKPGQILAAEARLHRPTAKPKAKDSDIRVMQWNLLADGLSLDGFVTPMVTQEFASDVDVMLPHYRKQQQQKGKEQQQQDAGAAALLLSAATSSAQLLQLRRAREEAEAIHNFVPINPMPPQEEEEADKGDEAGGAGAGAAAASATAPAAAAASSVRVDEYKNMLKRLQELSTMKGHEKAAAASRFVDRYATPAAQRNLEIIQAFRGRLLRYLTWISTIKPDILTVQELDKYEDFSQALEHLGYTSVALPPSGTRRRGRSAGHGGEAEGGGGTYVPLWRRTKQSYIGMLRDGAGRCFAPKENSTAFAINAQRSAELESAIRGSRGGLGVGRLTKIGTEIKMDLSFPGEVTSKSIKKLRTSSDCVSEDLAKMGVTGALDDDGVAIFWKRTRFEPTSTAAFQEISKGCGVVRVSLLDKETKKNVVVVAAHLKSGNSEKDSRARATQVARIKTWLQANNMLPNAANAHANAHSNNSSPSDSHPKTTEPCVVLCLDANASPFEPSVKVPDRDSKAGGGKERKEEAGADNTLGRLRGFGLRSCWDADLEKASKSGNPFDPVTVNKIRGPLSDQKAKVGQHSCSVIDYVMYSPQACSQVQFALEPVRVGGSKFNAKALACLIPNMEVPSDHYPVAVDLRLASPPSPPPAAAAAAAAAENNTADKASSAPPAADDSPPGPAPAQQQAPAAATTDAPPAPPSVNKD